MNTTHPVPIKAIAGVELVPTEREGIAKVVISDTGVIKDLSWDRYVRLKAAADAIRQLVGADAPVLDAGGFDGALGLFLSNYTIDLLDPATTGASLLKEPADDQSYDLVASVDVLEHIAPDEREQALHELCRIARKFIVINYPHSATKQAQELVFKATGNALIKEHVQWELPDTDWVLQVTASRGFKGTASAHSSLSVWLGQYLLLNLAPAASKELNQYLIEHHAAEPFTTPLYDLVVCEKIV